MDDDSTDFTANVLARIMSTPPEELQGAPAGGTDDFGQGLKEFKCRRCGRTDHIDPWQYEILNRHGVLCTPCHVPHLFGAKQDPDMPNGWILVPKPAGQKPRSRLGEPERRELQARVNELLDLKIRRDHLHATILKMQDELSGIEPRIAALTGTTIPAATAALEKIETDPLLEKRQESADVLHDLHLEIAKLAKAAREKRRHDESVERLGRRQ